MSHRARIHDLTAWMTSTKALIYPDELKRIDDSVSDIEDDEIRDVVRKAMFERAQREANDRELDRRRHDSAMREAIEAGEPGWMLPDGVDPKRSFARSGFGSLTSGASRHR